MAGEFLQMFGQGVAGAGQSIAQGLTDAQRAKQEEADRKIRQRIAEMQLGQMQQDQLGQLASRAAMGRGREVLQNRQLGQTLGQLDFSQMQRDEAPGPGMSLELTGDRGPRPDFEGLAGMGAREAVLRNVPELLGDERAASFLDSLGSLDRGEAIRSAAGAVGGPFGEVAQRAAAVDPETGAGLLGPAMSAQERAVDREQQAETAETRERREQQQFEERMKLEREKLEQDESQFERGLALDYAKLAAQRAKEAQKLKEKKQMPAGSAQALSSNAMGLVGIRTLQELIDKKDLTQADVRRVWGIGPGKITNPQASLAIDMLTEAFGRSQSGAAISAKEWKNFRNLIFDPNLWLTEEGRNTIQSSLDAFEQRTAAAGNNIYGGDEWQEDYGAKALSRLTKDARAEATGGATATWGQAPAPSSTTASRFEIESLGD